MARFDTRTGALIGHAHSGDQTASPTPWRIDVIAGVLAWAAWRSVDPAAPHAGAGADFHCILAGLMADAPSGCPA